MIFTLLPLAIDFSNASSAPRTEHRLSRLTCLTRFKHAAKGAGARQICILIKRDVLIYTALLSYRAQMKAGRVFPYQIHRSHSAAFIRNDTRVVFSCPTHDFAVGHIVSQEVEHHIDLVNTVKEHASVLGFNIARAR